METPQDYTERDSRIGRCQGGSQILDQGFPAPKQLNLKSLAMQAGVPNDASSEGVEADPKICGCPTPAEPILESQAVYLQECVIAGCDKNQEWLLPWWWSHYSQHNAYPVAFVDFGMSEEGRAWCRERGSLFEAPQLDT